ncbi:MAG: hypothetical protein ACRCS7_11160 [Tannerellaceae bacterium]
MKKLSYFAAFFAAMTMFSCSTNDDPTVDPTGQGDRVVKFTITSEGTKTEHPGVPAGAQTEIKDGVIYFCNSSGNAVYSYTLSAADISSLAGPTVQTISVPNVPASASQIVMGANAIQAGITYPSYAGQSITTLSSFTFNIKNQQPFGGAATTKPVDKIVMSGSGNIATDNTNPNAPVYSAEILLTPSLSRLEVKAVRCETDPTNVAIGDVMMFRIKGIFVPNHSATGTVTGVGSTTLVKPINTLTDNFYTASFPLASGIGGYLNDYNATGLSKDAANFWAYHTFPAKNVAVGDDRLPHIVVAIDNVYQKNSSGQPELYRGGNVQYITLTKYLVGKYNENPTASLTEFKKGYVYRIDGKEPPHGYMYIDDSGNPVVVPNLSDVPSGKTPVVVTLPGGEGGITFTIDDLTDQPYDADKTINCKITVYPWQIQQITPDL